MEFYNFQFIVSTRTAIFAVLILQGFSLFGQFEGDDTSPPCNLVEYLGDGPLVAVQDEEGKYGYVTLVSQKLIVPYQFYVGYDFQNGSALVGNGAPLYREKRYYGIINELGEFLVTFDKYEHIEHQRFENGEYEFTQKCKYGLLDSLGNEIIPPKYTDVKPFSEGLARVSVMKNVHRFYKKRNRINRRNNMLCPDYSYARHSYKQYWPPKPHEKFSFIDKDGKKITSFKYDRAYTFSEGYSVVGMVEGEIERYGFLDKFGKESIPMIYQKAGNFLNGLAAVKKGDKWGYINPENEIVIPFEFDDVKSVYNGGILNGELSTSLYAVKKNKEWGIINQEGKLVIPIKYKYIGGCLNDNTFTIGDGLKDGVIDLNDNLIVPLEFDFTICENGLIFARNNGKKGIYDKQGKLIQPTEFTRVDDFSEGLAAVEKDGQWGYINKDGQFHIPPRYDWCTPFVGGIALVKIGNEEYCIDRSGKTLK